MMKALVFLVDGFEESEAICPIDVLKRVGVDVVLAGVGKTSITSTHGVKVTTDIIADDVDSKEYDLVFCPGGMPGATNLASSKAVCNTLISMHKEGRIVSAICASPAVVLGPLGILEGKMATCYPGCEEFYKGFDFSPDGVVVDSNVVTGKSAGFAFDLGLKLVELLFTKERARAVQHGIYYKL